MARELQIIITAQTADAVQALKTADQAVDDIGKTSKGSSVGVDALSGKIAQFATAAGAVMLAQKAFTAVFDAMKAVGGVALTMNANLETSTLQFTTLMGDAGRAEAHVRSLFEFAKKTPFETGPIIAASKHLQLFGGDALNSQKNLTLLGDASAASGAAFEEVAFWTGRMYASLQAGKPIGEAMMRMTELGIVTPQARLKIEALASTAGGGQKAFEAFQQSLGQFTGAMELQASTFDGLMSTIKDAVQISIADGLKPFFDIVKMGAQLVAQVLGSEGMQRVMTGVATSISNTFGANPQAQVKGLLFGLVGLAEAAVTAAGVMHQAFSLIKLVIYGVIQGVAELVNGFVVGMATISGVAASIPGVGAAFDGMNRSLQDTKLFMQGATDEARKNTAAALEGVMGQGEFGQSLDGARRILTQFRVEIGKATITQQDSTKVTQAARQGVTDLGEAHVMTAKEIKAAEKAAKDFQKVQDAIVRMEAKEIPLTKIFQFTKQATDASTEALMKFLNSVTYFSAEGSRAWGQFAATVQQQTPQMGKSFDGLRSSLQGLPNVILGALQGGGNVLKSVGASIGGSLAGDLVANFGSKLPGMMSGVLSTVAGPLGSMFGSLAGSLAGKLFGKLFGPSQQQQVADMRQRFFDAGGGLQAMQERANLAGVSMQGLFNARTTTDFQRAMTEFNAQLEEAERLAAAAKAQLAEMNTELGGLLTEAANLGVVLPASMQASIDKLIEAGQLTDENRRLLEEMGAGGQNQFKAMEAAAKKYGVELSALGPAFTQNKLNEQAADIIQSFNTMINGGADLNAVIAGMSDEINKFVQEAIKSGSTVPENMRPILDAMLAQGKLTGENGQALKDLGGIKFGAPIETATDKLIKKMQELIDRITDGMQGAFSKATGAASDFAKKATDAVNSVPDTVRVRFESQGAEAYGFDQGGVVGRDFRRPSSRDVIPALLRPGEVVLTPEQARMSPRAGSNITVNVSVSGYLDSFEARSNLAVVVREELAKTLRRTGRAA
jgi:polyhydroxyalkanoate synthesis regulator phasin